MGLHDGTAIDAEKIRPVAPIVSISRRTKQISVAMEAVAAEARLLA